jgi:hypothetical protein
MATKTTTTIHELARAEIARQVQALTQRRNEITSERARLYEAQRKSGSAAAPLDPNELAARNVAKKLLNGSAPESLILPDTSSNITLDNKLFIDQRGIDIALRILTDKDVEARAAEAVVWAEANRAQWADLCREIVLTSIRLDVLGERVDEMLASCPDPFAVNMPMGNMVETRPISEAFLNELASAALSAGIVTPADIKRAKAR